MTRNLVTIIAAVLVICVAGIPIWRTASQLNERYRQTDLIKSGQNPNVISVNQQNFDKEILQETEKSVLILCYHTTLYGHQVDLLQQMARGSRRRRRTRHPLNPQNPFHGQNRADRQLPGLHRYLRLSLVRTRESFSVEGNQRY